MDIFHIEKQFKNKCHRYTPLKSWWGCNECFIGNWKEVLLQCERKIKKAQFNSFKRFVTGE
jgi:hypothetical protein